MKVWECNGSVEALNIALDLLEGKGCVVISHEYIHHELGTTVHLWYDEKGPEQRATIEKEELARVVALAANVRGDGNFFSCKNAEQRSMYLLHHYGVCGRDAAKITELLKPEMASLLGAE
jgi:hypothetical protein